jgi:hypothetical protein
VLQPLVEPLGYARLEPAKPVTTSQGSEDAGFLFQAEGGAMLRAWVVFREPDRAKRVLLKQRERIALLTDGRWLRILVFDSSGAGITLAIKLGHWRKARLLPDSFRLLRALCQPYGVATIGKLFERPAVRRSHTLMLGEHFIPADSPRRIAYSESPPDEIDRFKRLATEVRERLNAGEMISERYWADLEQLAGNDRFSLVIVKNLRREDELRPLRVTELLQWELLPTLNEGTRRFLENCCVRAGTVQVDESRVRFILDLKPDHVAVGRNTFDGYIAFIFVEKSVAVLENPIVGNALYVLRGNWRRLSQQSKRTLIQEVGEPLVRKIVHSGAWQRQLLSALGQGPPNRR